MEDDLVLVVDENIPRGQWRLGRVVLVHKGKRMATYDLQSSRQGAAT